VNYTFCAASSGSADFYYYYFSLLVNIKDGGPLGGRIHFLSFSPLRRNKSARLRYATQKVKERKVL
jgi:hypothetical protein